MALGSYPEVSLAEARKRRDEARKLVANDIDPNESKKQQKAENAVRDSNTVEVVANQWLEKQNDVLADVTRNMIAKRLKNDVFPTVGSIPLADLKTKDILEKVLLPIEARGTIETAHRVRSVLSRVLRYGVACGLCEHDVTTNLRGALKPVQRKRHAALDAEGMPDHTKVGALLRAIEGYDGSPVVKAGLNLHPLDATRPGELRLAEWVEMDF